MMLIIAWDMHHLHDRLPLFVFAGMYSLFVLGCLLKELI